MTDTDLAPTSYLAEPLYDGPQDAELADAAGFLRVARTLVTPMAPNTFGEALDWCLAQSQHRSKDWTGRCQEFCRTAPGCGAGFGSALEQWFGMPDSARHVGGNPGDAPTGATLFSRSRNPDALSAKFGHVIYAGRPFADNRQGAWSTDAVRTGWPDRVNPSDLYDHWNHEFLGWGQNMNGLWLDIKDPKPVQDQKYIALGAAVVDADHVLVQLRAARDTAKAQGDQKDLTEIKHLIAEQIATKKSIRAAFDALRHA